MICIIKKNNNKKTHSIVLLAICTADYEFTLVDIGDAGRQSDGGVDSNSKLGYAIDNNTIDIPPPEPIPTYNASKSFPYIFVADDAFQLKTYMSMFFFRLHQIQFQKKVKKTHFFLYLG